MEEKTRQRTTEEDALHIHAVQRVPELVASQLMIKGEELGKKETHGKSRRMVHGKDGSECEKQVGRRHRGDDELENHQSRRDWRNLFPLKKKKRRSAGQHEKVEDSKKRSL